MVTDDQAKAVQELAKLGGKAIDCVPLAGYRLTEAGMAECRRALGCLRAELAEAA